jgi:nitrate reductase assembly molybdenum cofactor insertion protein NarJ
MDHAGDGGTTVTATSFAIAPASAKLLTTAAEWRLLSLVFACPQGDWRNQLTALASEVANPKLKQAANVALQEAEEGVYHSAFGPGGPAAPREVSHRPSILTGQYLAEILASYDAFAYRPRRGELPDHIATELDFIAYLRLKQAFASAIGDDARAAVTAEAAQQFIDEHLATTAVPLAKILESSGIPYLVLAAAALRECLGADCAKAVSTSARPGKTDNVVLPICDVEDGCDTFSD